MISPALSTRTPNFDRVAGIYRWGEWISFGPWLSRCRRTFLARALASRRALIFGDGDGRFTARLLRLNPIIEIDAVDSSLAMLQSLLRRAEPHRARVHPQIMDARRWRWSGPPRYGLVVSHFFLDCFTTAEIRALAAAIRPSLVPGALWIVSEFAIPSSRFGQLLAAPLISALYRMFGLLTGLDVRHLPDHQAALSESGFHLAESRASLRGLLISELWILDTDQPF